MAQNKRQKSLNCIFKRQNAWFSRCFRQVLCRYTDLRRLTKKQALVFERQRFTYRVLQVSDSLCWIKVLPLWAKAVWQKHLESNTKQEEQQKRKQQFKKIFIWTLTDSGVSYPANHALWATQKKCLQQSSTQVTDLIIETALWQTKSTYSKNVT